MNDCPERAQLEQMLAGHMDASAEETLCEHVERCLPCQNQLDRLVSQDQPPGQQAQSRRYKPPEEEHFLQKLQEGQADLTPPMVYRGRALLPFTLDLRGPGPEAGRTLPKLPGYEILLELGRGGMGVVYRARQVALNRIVAIKMILAGEYADVRLRSRFQIEAEAAASLQHPNIVQIHEVGEHDGRPFFSMEFIAGGSLQERLTGEHQPARPATLFIETLARALHFAHEHNIVHRDLKPANILLQRVEGSCSSSGYWLLATIYAPKVTDFGVAKVLRSAAHQTQTGDLLGTPAYMAPEQAEGQSTEVGPAADIYGLGAILYQLLTGRPPFTGETPLETLRCVLHDEPVSVTRLVPGVPRDLETICLILL